MSSSNPGAGYTSQSPFLEHVWFPDSYLNSEIVKCWSLVPNYDSNQVFIQWLIKYEGIHGRHVWKLSRKLVNNFFLMGEWPD